MMYGTHVIRRGPLYYKLLQKEQEQIAARREADRHRLAVEAMQHFLDLKKKSEDDAEIARRMAAASARKAYRGRENVPMLMTACDAVGDFYGIDVESIFDQNRFSHIMKSRHLAIFMCVKLSGCSLSRIGRFFKRDHTTILHSANKVSYLFRNGDGEYWSDAMAIYRKISERIGEDLFYHGA